MSSAIDAERVKQSIMSRMLASDSFDDFENSPSHAERLLADSKSTVFKDDGQRPAAPSAPSAQPSLGAKLAESPLLKGVPMPTAPRSPSVATHFESSPENAAEVPKGPNKKQPPGGMKRPAARVGSESTGATPTKRPAARVESESMGTTPTKRPAARVESESMGATPTKRPAASEGVGAQQEPTGQTAEKPEEPYPYTFEAGDRWQGKLVMPSQQVANCEETKCEKGKPSSGQAKPAEEPPNAVEPPTYCPNAEYSYKDKSGEWEVSWYFEGYF